MRKSKRIGKRHIVIPDCQVKPGVKTDHLKACGNYIAEKRPDNIICLGDFGDVPSFTQWDKPGSAAMEGRRYAKDMSSVHRAMDRLTKPFINIKGYNPRMDLTLGNHEAHIDRMLAWEPKWIGTISMADLKYKEFGWKVHPFLKPVKRDGIIYSHYFTNGSMDRAISSAQNLLTKRHQSCIGGHVQGRDIKYGKNAEGTPLTCIICGSFYEHDEDYLSRQGNNHWRGIYVLNEVKSGHFDETAVSLNYLKRKYL